MWFFHFGIWLIIFKCYNAPALCCKYSKNWKNWISRGGGNRMHWIFWLCKLNFRQYNIIHVPYVTITYLTLPLDFIFEQVSFSTSNGYHYCAQLPQSKRLRQTFSICVIISLTNIILHYLSPTSSFSSMYILQKLDFFA